MRGDLVKREPLRLKHWEAIDLYGRIQQRNANGKPFVLHDGPPFTNGDVHLGTALNKILKDTILRYRSMRGFRTPYIPGWDCHGLPIEHKVALQLRESGRDLEPAQLREECAAFSRKYIETQRSQFKRLGVLADWEAEYRTMDPAYEAVILQTFAIFVELGLIYRSKKPVYWSIPCQTALAEAEVEYRDHTSPSIWVRFPIRSNGSAQCDIPSETSVVIWTTTPWTLPANLAVAVHPELEYHLFKDLATGTHLIVAGALAESFQKAAGLELELIKAIRGSALEGVEAIHPFIERPSPIVTADYVTTESGTGCVHIAPGHGMEDYLTGIRYKLPVYCPLDDNGCYVADEWMPKRLVGISVLETEGHCPANSEVLKILKETGTLLSKQKHLHSYPHCWRSKTPVIFRAMDQWFVGIDRGNMRQRVIEAVSSVQWVPEWGIKRILGAVENRPDWCISRQRSWGVPLPVFFRIDDGEPLLDAAVIRAIASKVADGGTNIWFTLSESELLDGIPLPEGFSAENLRKGTDTLDVWIDSGCSHRAVLKERDNLNWPADLYLEGSDQHRGWFQSSMWTGVIADGQAPFKQVLTHGFIVEETGEKISKSKGAMSSDGWVGTYGADIVRFWTASQDFRGDIRLSEKNFKRAQNTYRTIRNTLMYQLGNLRDFDPQQDTIAVEHRDALDQWALTRTADFLDAVTTAYEANEFHRVFHEVELFTGVTLSRIYHDIIKDRLYTSGRNWAIRRSSQSTIRDIFECLVRVIAPVLTFTADEAWSYFKNGTDTFDGSIHLEDWPEAPQIWRSGCKAGEIESIFELRNPVFEKLEALRKSKTIGRSLDASVILRIPEAHPLLPILQNHEKQLPELFIVSALELQTTSGDSIEIEASHAKGVQCPRSWRWVPDLVEAEGFGPVSPRDRDALLNP